MDTPGTFFAMFSLRQLVSDVGPKQSDRKHRGIPGGGIGGGAALSGRGQRHRSETLSMPISISGENEFDEQVFIESLKSTVEKLIYACGARVTQAGTFDGSFYSSEFFFEYTHGTDRGRIVISGNPSGFGYSLKADLAERSEGAGASDVDAFRMIKPVGDYNVVTFALDDPMVQDNKLENIGRALIKDSVDRISQRRHFEALNDLRYAEVWRLVKLPLQIQRLLAERDLEHRFVVPEEYQKYGAVFFLNDHAIEMYSEGGIRLETLKKISSAEMPGGCIQRSLRGPYVPK